MKNRDKVRAFYAKAKRDGDEDKAETIAIIAGLLGCDVKKKPTDASMDFTQAMEDEDYAEFSRRLDAS